MGIIVLGALPQVTLRQQQAMTVQGKDRKSLTIYDVAREAGISKSTAARAFDASASVKPATRQIVFEAAARLGFEMDPLAQRLARGRYEHLVDLFSPELDYGMIVRKVKAIQHLLNQQGFEVPLHSYSGLSSHQYGESIRKLTRRRPRAIVCNNWRLDNTALEELKLFQADAGVVTCFCYGTALDIECDQVIFDEEDNAYQAAAHLLERGHTDIGYSAHGDSDPNHPRILGIRRALQERGLTLNPEWIFFSGIYEDGGAELAQKFLALSEKPTAMCINNDVSAGTFVHYLMRAGLGVPDDVSVVGFDDSPAAPHCLVPLTSVSQPIWWDAEKLVEMLTERLHDGFDGKPRLAYSKGELKVRASTARLK